MEGVGPGASQLSLREQVAAVSERSGTLFDLRGRSALVIGGASGIGLAIAAGLAADGARVGIADRDPVAAWTPPTAIAEVVGPEPSVLEVDVREEDSTAAAVAAMVDRHGQLDAAFNLAAINDRREALELDLEAFRRVLDVNLLGLYAASRAIGRRMVAQGHGKLINVASILGHVGARHQAAYAASKGGVIQLTRVLAHEWAEHGVQVNALSPAHTRTPLAAPVLADPETRGWVADRILRGEPAEPWEIVGPALFLASDASNFVTGTSLVVDGGWLAG